MVTRDQRRRQLAREKYQRQQQRRVDQRHKARVRNAVIASVVAVVVAGTGAAFAAGAFKGDKNKDDAAGASPGQGATTAPANGRDVCARPAAGKPGTQQWRTEPAMSIDKGAKYTFTLRTTCGTIPLTLDAAKAPETVNSFAFLAGKGFFDHTRCHRLTTVGIYVLQCGDPTGKGSGGPGYTIADENLTAFGRPNPQGTVTYPAGTVAMANTGQPHTGGSQFFLVYKDSPLAPSYTPFGTISPDGLKVLSKIAKAGETSGQGDGAPNSTVVIDKASITKN